VIPQEIGIVLKTFIPLKNKISVLTKSAGKMTLAINPGRLKSVFSPGTVVTFRAKRNSASVVFPANLEVLVVPIDAIERQLYWFHHILEICYYFVPLGAACPDLFRLVQYCFELERSSALFEPYFDIVKKACLVKFFLLLGFYPESPPTGGFNPQREFCSVFDALVLASLDSANVQNVRSLRKLLSDIGDKAKKGSWAKDVDRWLLMCLQEHPHAAYFKTTSFFEKI